MQFKKLISGVLQILKNAIEKKISGVLQIMYMELTFSRDKYEHYKSLSVLGTLMGTISEKICSN